MYQSSLFSAKCEPNPPRKTENCSFPHGFHWWRFLLKQTFPKDVPWTEKWRVLISSRKIFHFIVFDSECGKWREWWTGGVKRHGLLATDGRWWIWGFRCVCASRCTFSGTFHCHIMFMFTSQTISRSPVRLRLFPLCADPCESLMKNDKGKRGNGARDSKLKPPRTESPIIAQKTLHCPYFLQHIVWWNLETAWMKISLGFLPNRQKLYWTDPSPTRTGLCRCFGFVSAR